MVQCYLPYSSALIIEWILDQIFDLAYGCKEEGVLDERFLSEKLRAIYSVENVGKGFDLQRVSSGPSVTPASNVF